MTHGSLFSGIGGFDLAAEWAGWTNMFHCEKEPFCQRILNYYWPAAELIPNITNYDFTKYANRISILTGGFPCQPFSLAGQERKGSEDNRYLWPEMLRAIKEIHPRWIVGENVYGLISWNRGLVFEQVQLDLEVAGYTVQPYILPACGKDAPHKRDRVWFVAHSSSKRLQRIKQTNDEQRTQSNDQQFNGCGGKRIISWEQWPTQPAVCRRNDGLSAKLDSITFPKWKRESIKAFGNAIVPQVALEIFKIINKIEEYEKTIIDNNIVDV